MTETKIINNRRKQAINNLRGSTQRKLPGLILVLKEIWSLIVKLKNHKLHATYYYARADE